MKTYDVDFDPLTVAIGCIAIVCLLALLTISAGWLFGIGLRLAGF